MIRDLPLQGRNFTQLLLLTPGVNPVSTAQGPQSETAVNSIEGNSGLPGGMIANASIQGQQNRSKVYYMDGIINTSVRAGTLRRAAGHRLAAGVQGPVAERQGGVRGRHRRRGQHDLEVGIEPVRRLRVRVLPQRGASARGIRSGTSM